MRTFRLPVLAALALLAFAVRAQDAPKPEAPAPEAKPEAAAPEPGPGKEPDPRILQDIAECLAAGLPEDWQRTWFDVREVRRDKTGKDRQYEARFFYATSEKGKPQKLNPCGAEQIVRGVGELNAYLPGDQQRWTTATFTFLRDGRFDAKYDFTPPKPAAKAAAKKKQGAAK